MHFHAAVKHGLLIFSVFFIFVHMNILSYAEGSCPTNLQELTQTKAQHGALGRAAASCTDPEGNQLRQSMGRGQHGVLAPVTTDFPIWRGVPLHGDY